MLLNRVKVLLGITNNDNEELLREIIEITEAKILNYINSSELPKQLEFVLVELSIKRFNRIGSEGFTSETFKCDLDSMNWIENPQLSNDGMTLSGCYSMKTIDPTVPGKQNLIFIGKVLGAKNGTVLDPVFKT